MCYGWVGFNSLSVYVYGYSTIISVGRLGEGVYVSFSSITLQNENLFLFIYLNNYFLPLPKELRIYLWLCSICLMLVVVVVGLSMIMDDVCLDLFIVKMARQLNIIHHLTHGSTHVWLF